jgi:AhpD family alkylhydroperoxidase
MSSFDHPILIQNISMSMATLRKSQPEAMQSFGQLAKAEMSTGALSEKHKEMMVLASSITQHCSGCIGFHVKAPHRLSYTREEFEEMLAVCVYTGGGPALIYASEAVAAWDAFDPAKA